MFLVMVVEVAIVMSASISLLLSGYGAIALMITLVVAKITVGIHRADSACTAEPVMCDGRSIVACSREPRRRFFSSASATCSKC